MTLKEKVTGQIQMIRSGIHSRDKTYVSIRATEHLPLSLTQQQATDIKLGLMLGQGRVRCVVPEILTLIQEINGCRRTNVGVFISVSVPVFVIQLILGSNVFIPMQIISNCRHN